MLSPLSSLRILMIVLTFYKFSSPSWSVLSPGCLFPCDCFAHLCGCFGTSQRVGNRCGGTGPPAYLMDVTWVVGRGLWLGEFLCRAKKMSLHMLRSVMPCGKTLLLRTEVKSDSPLDSWVWRNPKYVSILCIFCFLCMLKKRFKLETDCYHSLRVIREEVFHIFYFEKNNMSTGLWVKHLMTRQFSPLIIDVTCVLCG